MNIHAETDWLDFLQNFKPVAYPQEEFGKFYTGDSYIILNVSDRFVRCGAN